MKFWHGIRSSVTSHIDACQDSTSGWPWPRGDATRRDTPASIRARERNVRSILTILWTLIKHILREIFHILFISSYIFSTRINVLLLSRLDGWTIELIDARTRWFDLVGSISHSRGTWNGTFPFPETCGWSV